MARVELFERIRRDREFEGLSVHALARKHGVHRRAVRQALGSAVPPERKRPVGRPAPALGSWRELIDEWLIATRRVSSGIPRSGSVIASWRSTVRSSRRRRFVTMFVAGGGSWGWRRGRSVRRCTTRA